MQGPAYTITEIAALLARQVAKLTGLGAPYSRAVATVAERQGIEPAVVDRLVGRHEDESADRTAA